MGKLELEDLLILGELDELIRIVENKATRKVNGMTFAGAEPKDVVQEMLIRVYVNLPRYDRSKAKLDTFIESMLRSALCDFLRKCGSGANLRVVNGLRMDASIDPFDNPFKDKDAETYYSQIGELDDGYIETEFWENILHHMKISERDKRILELTAQGYAVVEIAHELGLTAPRISQIRSRLLDQYKRL